MLSMIYFVFFSVNVLTYFALTNVQNFLAILERLSTVFEMEEHSKSRKSSNIPSNDVKVHFQNCAFSWGFRVKENQKESKRAQVMIVVEDKPIINDLDFTLKSGDLMVVVGQVGSGKTTILHSVMEETKLCSGKQEIEGTIAYVE